MYILSSPLPGLIDALSPDTTVIGGWSTTRKLKRTAPSAFIASILGSSFKTIGWADTYKDSVLGFTTSYVNTAELLAYAAGGSLALVGPGVVALTDQSGGGNHLGRGNGNSYYCPITTPAGALNAAATVGPNSKSVPLLSTGYDGLSVANNGPFLSTAFLNNGGGTGVMNTDFGTASQFFIITALRIYGTSNTYGRIGSYVAAGDSEDFQTVTSVDLLSQIATNSTTIGSLRDASGVTPIYTSTIVLGDMVLIGAYWDGTSAFLYVNGVLVATGASSGSLGTGGTYGIGDQPSAVSDPFGNSPLKSDIAEQLIGTFSNSGTLFEAGDWTLMNHDMKTFYGIP